MTRFALLAALALAPLAPEAQALDPLLGVPSAFALVAADDEPGGDECLGSEEDQTACYVVAGIATAAFGAAAIVGLVREGNPCAYIGWGDCGECKDPERADSSVDERPTPRGGVGIAQEAVGSMPPAHQTPTR
ncbi:hypothetical protein [Rubricoccus marinus]|uniref:Uncharacterized protein n=1 Tax=Rubricoccus marinus TaxID=716817 RepID=A0A259TXK8_9BACT|nr:hypothetical protein [Rubricoccus marinus]OZC02426.1 hypothetical protein BSZ36_05205 [Rubricoccus marinus]